MNQQQFVLISSQVDFCVWVCLLWTKKKCETTNENVTILKLDLLKYICRFAHINVNMRMKQTNPPISHRWNMRAHSSSIGWWIKTKLLSYQKVKLIILLFHSEGKKYCVYFLFLLLQSLYSSSPTFKFSVIILQQIITIPFRRLLFLFYFYLREITETIF